MGGADPILLRMRRVLVIIWRNRCKCSLAHNCPLGTNILVSLFPLDLTWCPMLLPWQHLTRHVTQTAPGQHSILLSLVKVRRFAGFGGLLNKTRPNRYGCGPVHWHGNQRFLARDAAPTSLSVHVVCTSYHQHPVTCFTLLALFLLTYRLSLTLGGITSPKVSYYEATLGRKLS